MVKHADALGYDMVAVPEHFIIPSEHVGLSVRTTSIRRSHRPTWPERPSRYCWNSCITLLPLQNPIVPGQGPATADWLSSGRTMVTFGSAGSSASSISSACRSGNAAASPTVPRRDRRVVDRRVATVPGKYISFDDVEFEPKPVQKPHLPIWIGGDADAALRRAAKYATGWWSFLTPPEKIAERVAFIKSQPGYDGRDFDVVHGLGTNRVGEGACGAG